ncbi:MAG: hypothetical protein BHV94_00015 [Clostridiales bacterium 59_14]|nr:MAG: hypothetical protein BHV94_00015 [Clostridiales bacterium 59_14]
MRVFWNVLKNDLARTVCSKAFIFAALGLTAATFLTGMDELSYMTPENDLIYIYGIFQYLDFQLLFLLFAAIPGAALFCASGARSAYTAYQKALRALSRRCWWSSFPSGLTS